MQALPKLLLVDDDETFRTVLASALRKRQFAVETAENVYTAVNIADQFEPEFAVIDLKMPGPSGLELIKQLHMRDPLMRIVVLTGYASIATAVEAVKLGATHYLSKPANADEIVEALHKTTGDTQAEIAPNPMSVDRLEWEHIQRELQEHQGNISATARSLNMYRRTLQRKLAKYPVKK